MSTETEDTRDYFVHESGQEHGPYTLALLRERWLGGHLKGDALCFAEGFSEWAPIAPVISGEYAAQKSAAAAIPRLSKIEPLPERKPMPQRKMPLGAIPQSSILPPAQKARPRYQRPIISSLCEVGAILCGIGGVICLFAALMSEAHWFYVGTGVSCLSSAFVAWLAAHWTDALAETAFNSDEQVEQQKEMLHYLRLLAERMPPRA